MKNDIWAMLNESEQALLREIEPRKLRKLDEDELVAAAPAGPPGPQQVLQELPPGRGRPGRQGPRPRQGLRPLHPHRPQGRGVRGRPRPGLHPAGQGRPGERRGPEGRAPRRRPAPEGRPGQGGPRPSATARSLDRRRSSAGPRPASGRAPRPERRTSATRRRPPGRRATTAGPVSGAEEKLPLCQCDGGRALAQRLGKCPEGPHPPSWRGAVRPRRRAGGCWHTVRRSRIAPPSSSSPMTSPTDRSSLTSGFIAAGPASIRAGRTASSPSAGRRSGTRHGRGRRASRAPVRSAVAGAAARPPARLR